MTAPEYREPCDDPDCIAEACPEHSHHCCGDHTYEQHHSPEDHCGPGRCLCDVYVDPRVKIERVVEKAYDRWDRRLFELRRVSQRPYVWVRPDIGTAEERAEVEAQVRSEYRRAVRLLEQADALVVTLHRRLYPHAEDRP